MIYRVKYWRQVNPEFGEWVHTGLMKKEHAEQLAEDLCNRHEKVEVIIDESEKYKNVKQR